MPFSPLSILHVLSWNMNINQSSKRKYPPHVMQVMELKMILNKQSMQLLDGCREEYWDFLVYRDE
jgi:hypothetical protein